MRNRTYEAWAPMCGSRTLEVPLAVVAADIVSQRELVLRRGLVWQAVLASIAIPGIYPAQRIGPYVCVDGGVLNPFPVNVAADMGAGIVIGVKLGSGHPYPEYDVDVVAATERPPALLGVLMRSIEMMQRGIAPEADGRDGDHDLAEARPGRRGTAKHGGGPALHRGRRRCCRGRPAADCHRPPVA